MANSHPPAIDWTYNQKTKLFNELGHFTVLHSLMKIMSKKSSFEGSSATQPPQDFGQNDHQMSNVADSPAIFIPSILWLKRVPKSQAFQGCWHIHGFETLIKTCIQSTSVEDSEEVGFLQEYCWKWSPKVKLCKFTRAPKVLQRITKDRIKLQSQ